MRSKSPIGLAAELLCDQKSPLKCRSKNLAPVPVCSGWLCSAHGPIGPMDPNPKRLEREPDKIISILTNGTSIESGYEIRNIFLRLYIEKIDKELGPYSVITSLVETTNDSVEMIYDEGYFDVKAFENSSKFLINNLGISSVILRSLVFLDNR